VSRVTIIRTADAFPAESILEHVRRFIFGLFKGWSKTDEKGWRKIWKRLSQLEPGEFAVIEFVIPRSAPYHRRHFAILNAVFDAQERFDDLDRMRDWLSIGAGHVTWVPGAKGGIVPLPKSISYARADQAEFEDYHGKVMAFLRGEHAALFLWGRCGPKGEGDADKFARCQQMMDSILGEFNE